MTTSQTKSTKQLVKEDELATFLSKAEIWVEANWRYLAYGAAGLVVIVIIGWAMSVSRSNALRDGGYELAEARSFMNKGEFPQAVEKMNAIAIKRKGTEIATEAMLSVARIQLVQNKFTDAENAFNAFLKKFPNEGIQTISAINGLAVCYESQGKLQQAYEQFRKVYDTDKKGVAAPQALYDAARVAILLKDYEKAKQNALQLVREFPTSPLRSQADDILIRTGR